MPRKHSMPKLLKGKQVAPAAVELKKGVPMQDVRASLPQTTKSPQFHRKPIR